MSGFVKRRGHRTVNHGGMEQIRCSEDLLSFSSQVIHPCPESRRGQQVLPIVRNMIIKINTIDLSSFGHKIVYGVNSFKHPGGLDPVISAFPIDREASVLDSAGHVREEAGSVQLSGFVITGIDQSYHKDLWISVQGNQLELHEIFLSLTGEHIDGSYLVP